MIVISLSVNEDDNPFTEFRWNVDFEAGVPEIAVNSDPGASPVSVITDGGDYYDTGLRWSVEFTPSLTDPGLAGAMVSGLLRDGDMVLGSNYGDVLRMTSYSDQVAGRAGDDIIEGRGGGDHLVGGAGADALYGGDGNDLLTGGSGDQFSYEDDFGDDVIAGGAGNDTLEGAYGADTFVFAHMGPEHADRVLDFDTWDGDSIALTLEAFPKLKTVGTPKAKFFDSGNKRADDKNDYLVYHKKNGALYYDPDGSGSKKPLLIAELDGNPKLKASDFDVI